MAMTSAVTMAVRAELSRLRVDRPCCRRAELATVLRLGGGVHLIGPAVGLQAEVETESVAHRMRHSIQDLYGHPCEVTAISPDGPSWPGRYGLRVVGDGGGLARQIGLLDQRGRPVRGLPPAVVLGGVCDAQAAWRGALLARGSLSDSGRVAVLEVCCPGPEAALALRGAARRMGITARTGETRGAYRVLVRDTDNSIAQLLSRLGARAAAMAWQQHRIRRQAQESAWRAVSFGDANLWRPTGAAVATVATVARVRRALALLGDDAPEHLLAAGQLRLQHPQASLDQLGALGDPPTTKNTISGRIRRLLALADHHAARLGVPTTESALPARTDT